MKSIDLLPFVFVPTLTSIAFFGISNTKRRRLAGEGKPPAWQRPAAIALVSICALFTVLISGFAALVIWIAAASALGWAVSNVLTIGDKPNSIRSKHYSLLNKNRLAEKLLRYRKIMLAWGLRHPRRSATAGAISIFASICALFTAGATLGAWWAVLGAVQRLTASEATLILMQARSGDNGTLSCLGAINAAQPLGATIRDLLSERSFSVVLPTDSPTKGADIKLQECILANGDDSAEIEDHHNIKSETYIISGRAASSIHTRIVRRLRDYEIYAATAADAASSCQQLSLLVEPDILHFVNLLRGDAHYAKARDLLESVPFLDLAASRTGLCS